ncbi:MAG: aminoacetone oxidase family FAD-binding enzyme, partial [Clostridia bacterium]|nr:aminoacetone oxidase family FAD-binding enzyme [Clostridia bacterium]
MKVIIVGAGPAGMMAGIKAAENGNEVLILEKNTIPGKKLNITGKGRCNISFVGDMEYFLSNVVTNPKFMMSSINNLDNYSLVDYVNSLGVKTKEERGNRVFLASDDASELTEALKRELKRLNVKIQYSSVVKKINVEEDKVTGIRLEDGSTLAADKVIIAVGGKSYPLTGSTGDGYTLAKEVGHTITDIRPALVPFRLKETDICKSLKGVSLRNVALKVNVDGKEVDNRFGEMVFTDKGISGPIVLSSSSKINKIQDLDTLAKENKVKVYIDLKPALDKEKLYKRITRDFEKYSNKEFKN